MLTKRARRNPQALLRLRVIRDLRREGKYYAALAVAQHVFSRPLVGGLSPGHRIALSEEVVRICRKIGTKSLNK